MMLTDLLNNLKNNILLWAKADDRLGFSVDKDIGFDADLKAEVAARKDELLTLLQDNGVTSEQLAKEKSFLRLPPSSWPLALDSIQQGALLQIVGGDKLIIPFADGAAHEPIQRPAFSA